MAAAKYSFDVHTKQGSRWVTDCVCKTEQEARKRANELFADSKCAGVRVVRTWNRPDGLSVDTEIFSQLREVKEEAPIRITPVESVKGKCQTLKDFAGFDSRQTMSRIFRDYMAKAVVTPTEIIYNFFHLKRLNEKDNLVSTAVDMVATLQSREEGQDARVRRDEIHRAVDEMIERARALDPARLPTLDQKFSIVMKSLSDVLDRDQRNYVMLAALSRDLTKLTSWVSKLELLCKMAEAEAETEVDALELLDGVIADVLGTDVIQDILGSQSNLGTTICALLDLADGSPPGTRTSIGEVTTSLCGLLKAGKVPASRRCIVDRAHRALRLPAPLRNNDREREPEELRKIIARVVTPTGLHSGPDTAHALTTRFSHMVEEGGKTGRRAAIKGVFLAMPDMAHGVLYLCDAARSDLAADHLGDMETILKLVLQTKAIRDFCHRDLNVSRKMGHSTAAYHAVAASPFSAEARAEVTGHIDELLERFVVEEKIIERLDLPESHLRDRALRLLRFCDSGLLPKGKSLQRAHARVLSLLKQPDFPARFVAGIEDPQAAETALRNFFVLLKRSEVQNG